MVTRNTYTSSSPAVSGDDYMDDMAEKSDLWFNNMTLIPSTIVNSDNDYTITVDPPLKSGQDVAAGMGFFITPNADNTGNVQLRVTDSNPYYPVLKADGSQITSGAWNTATTYFVVFADGAFRIMNTADAAATLAGLVDEQIFTASGTWTKPEGLPTTAMVEVWVWGGGGGGGRYSTGTIAAYNSTGGGGACNIRQFKITDLADTETVTVGGGGAKATTNGTAGGAGGTSSFGTLMEAYGGGGGAGANQAYAAGAGGGGTTEAGQTPSSAWVGGNGGKGLDWFGRDGQASDNGAGGLGFSGGGGAGGDTAGTTDAISGFGYYGGGAGAAVYDSSPLAYGTAGKSYYGGGGGSGNDGEGGTSVYGGKGGSPTEQPEVPGGGGAGGTSDPFYGNGADGQVMVRIYL